jgi:tetratricopeptide (TPR) repeat protein
VAARGKKPIVRELPAFIEPMLAKPADPFDSDEHLFEVKWDGTRAMCFVGAGGVRLMNRRRRDITFRYPDLACLKNLPKGTILDGEIVVLRRDGSPDFAALQIRDQCEAARKIKAVARSHPAAYIVFDQLYERYRNVMDRPLVDRRERARATVARCGDDRIVMSEGVTGEGIAYFNAAVERGLESVPPTLKLATGPTTASEWHELAIEQEQDGYLTEAVASYRDALLAGGPDVQIVFDLAHALHQLGRREEAVERYRQAVEMAPAFIDAWNNLGVLLTEAEQLEEACECFRRALAADPGNPMTQYNLADTLTDKGHDAEALPHWKAYLQADSQSERAAYARRQLA